MTLRDLIEELREAAEAPAGPGPLKRRVTTRRHKGTSSFTPTRKRAFGRPGTVGRRRFAGIGRKKRETPDDYRTRTGQCPPGYRFDGVHCRPGKPGSGAGAISPRAREQEKEEQEERRKARRAALKRAATKARVDKALKGPDSAAVAAAPADARRILARIPRRSWWRADQGQPQLADVGHEEFYEQHTGISKRGSALVGTPRMRPAATAEEKRYFRERVLPTVIVTATRAVERMAEAVAGVPVTFLAEGKVWWKPNDLTAHYPNEGEQYQVAVTLYDRFADRVGFDTWDDDEVALNKYDAKVWEPLTKLAGSGPKAHTAISAMLLAHGEDLASLRRRGILTTEASEYLREQGLTLDHPSESLVAAAHRLAFPLDFGKPHTELSAIVAGYTGLRQQNLVRKMRAVEDQGGIAIVTPDAPHAWNLKFVVEESL